MRLLGEHPAIFSHFILASMKDENKSILNHVCVFPKIF